MLSVRIKGEDRMTSLSKVAGQFFIGGQAVTSLKMSPDDKSIEVSTMDKNYSVVEVRGYDSLAEAYGGLVRDDPPSGMTEVMAANAPFLRE